MKRKCLFLKRFFSLILILSILLLFVPSVPMLISKISDKPKADTSAKDTNKDTLTFNVLDTKSGQVTVVDAKDYVIGAVLAEMPSSYHKEALKAQAVAAFTYALKQQKNEEISPTPELYGADFSNDSTKYQAYFSVSEAKEKFGTSYSEANKKVTEAVNEVYGQYLVYDNEPIAAAYHSISSGITESAKNVWGDDISYLKEAKSEYDLQSPDYEYTVKFSADELKSKLLNYKNDLTFEGNPKDWIKLGESTSSGTVKSVNIGTSSLSGAEFRLALGLRSACFTVTFSDNTFSINTKGYGHGVGLSQYGANGMAYNGYSYDAILKHYYTGVEIKKIF